MHSERRAPCLRIVTMLVLIAPARLRVLVVATSSRRRCSSRCSRRCSAPDRISPTPWPTTTATAISTCSSASTASRIGCIATTRACSPTWPPTAGVADARPTRAAAWGDFDADGDPDLLLGFTPLKDASVLRLYRNNAGKFTDATTDAGLDGGDRRRAPAGVDRLRRRRRSRSLHRLPRSRQRAVSQRRRQVHRRRARRSASPTRAAPSAPCGSTSTRTAISTSRSPTWTATPTACSATTAASSPTSPRRPAWRGAAARRRRRRTAPCACAPPTSTTTASFDLFAANYGPLGFFRNRGKGTFEDRSAAWGIAIDSRYDACAFADFDHDGTLDLYVNGTVTGGASWQD